MAKRATTGRVKLQGARRGGADDPRTVAALAILFAIDVKKVAQLGRRPPAADAPLVTLGLNPALRSVLAQEGCDAPGPRSRRLVAGLGLRVRKDRTPPAVDAVQLGLAEATVHRIAAAYLARKQGWLAPGSRRKDVADSAERLLRAVETIEAELDPKKGRPEGSALLDFLEEAAVIASLRLGANQAVAACLGASELWRRWPEIRSVLSTLHAEAEELRAVAGVKTQGPLNVAEPVRALVFDCCQLAAAFAPWTPSSSLGGELRQLALAILGLAEGREYPEGSSALERRHLRVVAAWRSLFLHGGDA